MDDNIDNDMDDNMDDNMDDDMDDDMDDNMDNNMEEEDPSKIMRYGTTPNQLFVCCPAKILHCCNPESMATVLQCRSDSMAVAMAAHNADNSIWGEEDTLGKGHPRGRIRQCRFNGIMGIVAAVFAGK